MQAALYAYLLGVDDVIMVCSFLGDKDYENPDAYQCSTENTIVRPFKLSERYPELKKTIKKVEKWWKTHVEGGVSPKFDEKADADILKVLRDNNLSPDTDIAALVAEAEQLKKHIDEVKGTVADDEKRYKTITDMLKKEAISQFKEGDKTVMWLHFMVVRIAVSIIIWRTRRLIRGRTLVFTLSLLPAWLSAFCLVLIPYRPSVIFLPPR